MSNNKLINDLLKRKPYLKEENKSPNIGDFQYGKTSNVQEILGGVNAYRYNIYKNTNKKGTIKNLGGGNPIPFKTYKYVKKGINDYLDKNILSNYPHTSGNPKLKNEVINYLNSINVNVENNDIDLIIELYKKDKIKLLPGSSFRWNNKDDIIGRITFSLDIKTLINNMKALSKIINNI